MRRAGGGGTRLEAGDWSPHPLREWRRRAVAESSLLGRSEMGRISETKDGKIKENPPVSNYEDDWKKIVEKQGKITA